LKTSKGTGQVKGQGTEEGRTYRCQGTGQRAGEEKSDDAYGNRSVGGGSRAWFREYDRSGSTIGQGVR
jgi:hypothetical protein